MSVKTARQSTKRKGALEKVRVLIAVEPTALVRVIEHLFGGAPEIQIVSHSHGVLHLARQVKRLQPDLVIANARLLGPNAREVFGKLKQASPHSKLIFTYFDRSYASPAGRDGVDVYLEEDTLVARLVSTTRQ